VTVDQNVDFSVDAFPSRTFHGKVVQVRNAPITVQNVVTYDTVIGVSNADLKLKPGMTANVSIIIAHKDDVLKISNAALRYRPANAPTPERPVSGQNRGGGGSGGPRATGRTVYVLRGGKAEPVQIKTGISDGTTTEVWEGLGDNDRAITGQLNAPNTATSQQQGNPFGGPRRFP
jgi:HlyD family secretion protein